ncbi:hypothetical protein ABT354_37965, partial [Streptomyces sp. NPDC000594]|uniref:hypothetical protein n=1 Tax=Streptomyces sp. NPDC000594 TaxID=3154261 RepID=UPI00331F5740
RRTPDSTDEVVQLLVRAAVADGGRTISLHLAEQNRTLLVLALSHRPDPPALDDSLLPALHRLGVLSCGTETGVDGRRLFAVLSVTL